MAQTTAEAIQQLYVAYFNRPAEPGGLAYWTNAIAKGGGTLRDVSTAFSASPEYQAQFAGLQPDQIIARIYDNLFNRAPDPSGLKYWSGNLASGAVSVAFIVDAIASSAVNNPAVSPADTAAITSKITAATKFTDLLKSDATIERAYGMPWAGEVAKAYIHSVKDAATLATATTNLPTATLAKLLATPPGAIYNNGVLYFAETPVLAVDGTDLAHFATLDFTKAATIVDASQKLVAHGALTATAVGYAVAEDGAVTYRGNLDVTADRAAQVLTLNADTATVKVAATAANATAVPPISGNADATIKGDVQKLTVNTVNSVDARTPTTDTLASATITVTNNVGNLAGLTALTLTGNGTVTVDNGNSGAATRLALIDASALGGKLTVGTHKGEITGGLAFTGNANVAEDIHLGAGHDVLTLHSNYGAMDTLSGFDIVKETATADRMSTTDVMYFGGLTIDGASANPNIVKFALTAADTSLPLAFVRAATVADPGQVLQFVYGGNTYLFADTGATLGELDADDAAIKLVGTVDLTTAFGVHV